MKIEKIKLNSREIGKLLKSKPVTDDLERRAKRIARAAGEGFETSTFTGRNRSRASVITATHEARRAEARDRTLTRSIDAGRMV